MILHLCFEHISPLQAKVANLPKSAFIIGKATVVKSTIIKGII